MSDKKSTEGLPEIMASVIAMIPPLVLKTGWAYLMMKKRAQRVSKDFESVMVKEGMPPEMARQLRYQYETDISVRRMVKNIPFTQMRRSD